MIDWLLMRPAPAPRFLASLLFALALLGSPLTAQEPVTIEGLGSLSFPNSGAEDAQDDFLRGVLLLHSFEYAYAAEAFRAAQATDPDFALAYWGEALTYIHPVWNEKDVDAARAALNRYAPSPEARANKAPTERERLYVQAVDLLYGPGEKATLDTLYADAMGALATAYPSDLEARTFHALSLLGLSQGDRDVPTYIEAGAIALAAFQENPNHPGAAHYTIHAFDDPTHAILAMEAARAYGPIAPDAGHAQHMTTHIFLARGMWDDVVEANQNADAVTDRNLARRDLPPTNCGHYNEWLMYGYAQQGRYDDAEALLMGCFEQAHDERFPDGMRRAAASSYAYMRSLNLADTRDGNAKPALSTVDVLKVGSVPYLMQAWGVGVAALHRGDRTTAEASLAVLDQHADRVEESYNSPYVPVWRGTLNALLLVDRGDLAGAHQAAHDAAEFEASLPIDFGPPIAFKPARELEGEILLEMGNAQDAKTAFSQQLARTPQRIATLAGYAEAALALGQGAVALETYRTLDELLQGADAGMTVAVRTRAFLATRAPEMEGSR